MRLTCSAAVLSAALLLSAGTIEAQGVAIPVGLNAGIPQGAFAENVDVAGGLAGGLLFRLSGAFAIRTDLGFMVYGSDTRRVPLGGGALGLINVDVTTTNSIFNGGLGAQLGMPGASVTPYLGGSIGFSAFTTSSSVSGSNSSDQPFASSTNSSDWVFARNAFAGLYVPVGKTGSVRMDLGARYTWNGERVRYLTEGDITEDGAGNIVLTPRTTRADLLTIVIGVTFTPRKPQPK